jgi:hypothetical protein
MTHEDELAGLWRCELPPPSAALAARVMRQHRRRRWQRGFELALTLVAASLFAAAALTDRMHGEQWLVLPFFLGLLPVMAAKLRRRRPRPRDLRQTVAAFAGLRLIQLKDHLRDLYIERQAAIALLVYAVAAELGVCTIAGLAALQRPALKLLLCALVWYLVATWFVRRRRVGLLREYRAMRRLVQASTATR